MEELIFDGADGRYDERDLGAIRSMPTLRQEGFRDDADTIFFARQLEHVKARIYTRKVPALTGMTLIPISTDTPEYAEIITTRWFDEVGYAKVIANYADDLPRADVRMNEVSVRVRTLGDSYGYNINEIRASRATGAGLDVRKAAAARRAIDQKLNRIALVGDADYGLYGLTNFPNLPDITLTTGDWTNATTDGDEILRDLNQMWVAYSAQNKGVHKINKVLLPPAELAAANTKVLTGMLGQTAGSFFRQMHPGVEFVEVQEFSSVNGAQLIIMGEFTDENIRFEMVMPFNQLPPQERNLEAVVPCMARTGGVNCDYPLAFLSSNDI